MAIFDIPLENLRRRRSIKWARFAPDVLPLFVAEMDAKPVPAVVDVLSRMVAEGDTGYPELPDYQEAFVPQTAATIAGNVIAANALGEALLGLERTRNLVELVFLDPAGQDLYADWLATARGTVAGLRRNAGLAPDDQRLRAVLADALARSETFRELWATYDVAGKAMTRKTLVHPEVGRLDLVMQTFEVRSAIRSASSMTMTR